MSAHVDPVLAALRAGVVPAVGCTEPVAVALAAAHAARLLGEPVERIESRVSPNVMKNGLAVMVPGTGRPGLAIAAAAGALGGDPDGGLGVLAGLAPSAASHARELVDDGRVGVEVARVDEGLFVEVELWGALHRALARIAGGHDRLVLLSRDGLDQFRDVPERRAVAATDAVLRGMTLREVVSWCLEVPLSEVGFVADAEPLTRALVQEGLRADHGLRVGRVMAAAGGESSVPTRRGELPQGLVTRMLAHAAAASDARMGGAPLAAMTNAGSGNQGITVTVPVLVVADALDSGEDDRLRALVLAHLVALHVHSRLPVLSGFCATLSAAMGAAAGMVWLLGGSYDVIARAVNTMAGDAAGMVCDGAGCTCTLKVCSSVGAAARAVQLALAGIGVPGTNGLVHDDVDDTLRALGEFACRTRDVVDGTVLQIMVSKP